MKLDLLNSINSQQKKFQFDCILRTTAQQQQKFTLIPNLILIFSNASCAKFLSAPPPQKSAQNPHFFIALSRLIKFHTRCVFFICGPSLFSPKRARAGGDIKRLRAKPRVLCLTGWYFLPPRNEVIDETRSTCVRLPIYIHVHTACSSFLFYTRFPLGVYKESKKKNVSSAKNKKKNCSRASVTGSRVEGVEGGLVLPLRYNVSSLKES